MACFPIRISHDNSLGSEQAMAPDWFIGRQKENG